MAGPKSLLAVLTLLLLSPYAQSISWEIDDSEDSSLHSNQYTPQGVWRMLANPMHSTYHLSESSGLIHSPYGSFDPTTHPVPLGPWSRVGLGSPTLEGIYIIQSSSSDLEVLTEQLSSLGISIIDQIPDEALVVSLPETRRDEALRQMQHLPAIRWSGDFPTLWTISPELLPLLGFVDVEVDLDLIPSSNLMPHEIAELSADLGALSRPTNPSTICDAYLCQLRSVNPKIITTLAIDPRIIKVEPGPTLAIHNTNASLIGGLDAALTTSDGLLTGDGEVIGISDTGLDSDHGDFEGRLRNPIYNRFGPDNSGADTNSGHGTHVTATLLGDGSGDSIATGMVPEATFHFYQLEVDSSGLLARWGSLYEMFLHSWQNDARIQTNSWGSENLVGQYTSDSRSADSFTYDYPKFLVLFSAGDMAEMGVNPPSTAKNVLSVGSTTTGAYDSETLGAVHASSSVGPTLDGRIKPDLVAPGVMLCSARAQEAAFATGGPCSSTIHDDGSTPLYMTLNGSSMATPVVAGAAAMARQYLREVAGISEPRSDLIRALLVNGAEDLGEPDVPNPSEGWGQLNLTNSLYPTKGGQNLSVLFDYDRDLLPGHSFIYTFELFEGVGFDATLAWNDREGSATADQNASRLINDLDLTITSPEGTVYRGNNFVDGISSSGGNRDQLNNLERVSLPTAEAGMWTIQIGHSGGFSQDFSLLFSAMAEERMEADLTVLQDSISTMDQNPLQDETVSIQLAWSNQAAAQSGQYSIMLEDISEGDVIRTDSFSSLGGGGIESHSLYHSFSTTGEHVLRLTLDYLSQVDELNDETTGTDNNVFEFTFQVTQIGVRATPLMKNGSLPGDYDESIQARSRNLDPSTTSWVVFQIELRNEGTSEVDVKLSVSHVQIVDEAGILNSPGDEWWRILNESGDGDNDYWTLSPSGQDGDRRIISLNLSDRDADISDTAEARYALPGNFVSDLTLYDKNAPTISHTIRLSINVQRVEGLFTIAAGTEGLGAEPGEFAVFSLSIKNIGNGPTQYLISCDSQNRWLINIGNSQSSNITLGPLSRLQFVPIPIRVRVPPPTGGLPAGTTEQVTCVTTSVNDPALQTTEEALVEVFESRSFSTEIYDADDNPLGPIALAEIRPVLNGDYVSTLLAIGNEGNIPLEFEVGALASSNLWPIQVYETGEGPPIGELDSLSVLLQPGDSVEITIRTIVPLSAQKGDRNTITIKTTLEGGSIVSNGTELEVKEITTLDVQSASGFSIAMGRSGNAEVMLHNSGNVPLSIELTLGTIPDGWSGGFLSGKQFSMDMNRDSVISIGLELPGSIQPGPISESVPVIVESTSPTGAVEIQTINLDVTVVPSVWLLVEGETIQLQGIGIDQPQSFVVSVHNLGNIATGVSMGVEGLEDWDILLVPASINDLGVGDSAEVRVAIRPTTSSDDGLKQLRVIANSTVTSDDVTITESIYSVEVSRDRSSNNGGLSGVLESIGLPAWSLAIFFLLSVSIIIVVGVRLRRTHASLRPEEEIIPRGSALQAGSNAERRAAALDTSSSGEVITGEVSDSEIQDALASSLPSSPMHQVPEGAAPLPRGGLPDGWTMEQWAAYGSLWWEQNSP